MNSSNPQFLNDDNSPNLTELQRTFERCGPTPAGGLAWLDNIRFNKWARQSVDGKKHDVPNDPHGAAFPFDGASDVRPMMVDDIVNEMAALLQVAFWEQQMQPGSVGTDDEGGGYAVALWEHILYRPRTFSALIREVELSSQYVNHYGWFGLAPRWVRQMSVRRQKVTMAGIRQAAAAFAQQQQQQQAAQQQVSAGAQGGSPSPQPSPPGEGESQTGLDGAGAMGAAGVAGIGDYTLADLPLLIVDPLLEDQAVKFMTDWYDNFVAENLPEDMQDQAPDIKEKTVRRVIKELRQTGESFAPLPYLARNEPEIVALKPWDEIFLPPELATENEIVFIVERLHESDLRNRIITEDYDKAWVEAAVKYKGALTASPMEIRSTPLGIGGLVGGATSSPVFSAQPTMNNTLIEIVHAVYHGVDDDGVPAVWCTTYHRQVTGQNTQGTNSYALNGVVAKHEMVEDSEGELPYVAGAREWWCRSVVASRSIPERAHTQQNVVKGLIDSVIDRASILAMPPVNVYESPLGTQYRFGPAKQNYVKMGKEPRFMEMPNGQGGAEAMQTLEMVKKMVDNSYALPSGEVNPARMQTMQKMMVQKFLASWNMAKQHVLNLCRRHMEDQDFADITGAPAGWLDGHRDDTDSLALQFHFDVRELDPELNLKRIESMNQIALPNDVLGVINRGQWAQYMVRAILGPRAAKMMVTTVPDASSALREKAESQVMRMFAGNAPQFMDKQDPTAASLLQFTVQNVMQNPTYLAALNGEALGMLAKTAGQPPQQVMMAAQQARARKPGLQPDDLFSTNLAQWLQNLQFIGVTQQQNRQIGRQGVKPQQDQMGAGAPNGV